MLFNNGGKIVPMALWGPALGLGLAGAALHAGPITDNQLKMKLEDRRQVGFVDSVRATYPMAYFRLNAAKGGSEGGTTRYTISGGAKIGKPGAPIGVGNTHCVQLDGHTGYVSTTQAGGIDAAASMMAFVNLDSLPSDAKHAFYILGESQDGHGIDLQFGEDDTLQFHTGDGSALSYAPSPATLAHAWHLVIATSNPVTHARVIYWDGETVAHDKGSGTVTATGPLSIGAPSTPTGQFFSGGIAEAALWNRALTANDVEAIHNTVSAR